MPDFKKNTTPAMKKTMAYSKADPTAFKMRSGNGPLAFKEMGATPANFSWDSGGSNQAEEMSKLGEEINKPADKPIKIDDSKTEKVKPQKIDIVTENPETGKREKIGETNTSSRPEGSEAVTKTPEEQGMQKPEKEAPEAKEKKGLWQRYKDHVGSKEYHQVKDSMNELANVLDKSQVRDTGSTKAYTSDLEAKTKQAQEERKLKNQDEQKQIKEQRATEKHKQDMEYKKALTETHQRKLQEGSVADAVAVQEEADADQNKLDETESFTEQT